MHGRTQLGIDRLTLEGRIQGGKLDGTRHIIGADTAIDGGVSIGAYEREIIVVDSSISQRLIGTYEEAKKMSTDDAGEFRNDWVLQVVYDLTKEILTYDRDEVDRIIEDRDSYEDGKISLGIFLQEGFGICRHHYLLIGFMLERFREEGFVEGEVSVDRITFGPEGKSGHAFVRYTNSDGVPYILDSAGNYIGPLHKDKGTFDFYSRPTDKWKEPN